VRLSDDQIADLEKRVNSWCQNVSFSEAELRALIDEVKAGRAMEDVVKTVEASNRDPLVVTVFLTFNGKRRKFEFRLRQSDVIHKQLIVGLVRRARKYGNLRDLIAKDPKTYTMLHVNNWLSYLPPWEFSDRYEAAVVRGLGFGVAITTPSPTEQAADVVLNVRAAARKARKRIQRFEDVTKGLDAKGVAAEIDKNPQILIALAANKLSRPVAALAKTKKKRGSRDN
jgi:hypothetical protein